MQFLLTDGREFEIPDAWLAEAGMVGFRPNRNAYLPAIPSSGPTVGLPITIVEISQIVPPRRNPGFVGLHKDRTIRILRGYVGDAAIEPVSVHPAQGAYGYTVADGFHRFHTSIAAGFTHLPVFVTPAWS